MSGASELRAAVHARFTAGARLLWVGAKGAAPGSAEVSSLDQLPHGSERFQGVVWLLRSAEDARNETELRAGLRRLRGLMSPGAVLALVIEPPGALRQLWGALGRSAGASEITLEQASEALIMTGLLEPRVLSSGRHGLALCAHTAHRFEPLDVFFEQPTH
jgi:hypothetical protein